MSDQVKKIHREYTSLCKVSLDMVQDIADLDYYTASSVSIMSYLYLGFLLGISDISRSGMMHRILAVDHVACFW